jgi:hypothetical protein
MLVLISTRSSISYEYILLCAPYWVPNIILYIFNFYLSKKNSELRQVLVYIRMFLLSEVVRSK